MMTLWALLSLLVAVECAPSAHKVEKKSGKWPVLHDLEDPVAALAALKPQQHEPIAQSLGSKAGAGVPRVRSLSRSSSSSKIIKEVNGERKELENEEEQVSRNGELVRKLLHTGETEQSKGGTPHSKGMTELQVPALNIHQRLYDNDGQLQRVDTPPVKRHQSPPAVGHVLMEPKPQEPQNTLEELAGYILETGDQASVVEFLQLLLEEGKITQEEAIEYIDAIKRMLAAAEREEEPMEDIEKIRELVRQGKQQEEEERKVKAIRDIMEDVSKEEAGESETFLRINDYLERGLKGGKLSRNTYNLLKEALIQSVLDKLQHEEAPLDYSTNY